MRLGKEPSPRAGHESANDDKYSKIRAQRKQFHMVLLSFVLVFLCALALLGVFSKSDKAVRPGLKVRLAQDLPATENDDPSSPKKVLKSIVKPAALSKKDRLKSSPDEREVPPPPPPPQSEQSEAELAKIVESIDAEVRVIKATGVIMETDEASLKATMRLQDATRKLLAARYGPHDKPYRIRVRLEFQDTMPDFGEKGADGEFLIEMAPVALVPHSVFTFMEIARKYNGGAFHRVAGHVLQAFVKGRDFQHLAFQEYSEQYPHKKGTVGYAGRPSGPGWYVSIQDNSRNHGPGSQQKRNPYEADSCFGRVIEGFDEVVVGRVRKMPGDGFINDPKKHVLIKDLQILVAGSGPGAVDGYVEWAQEGTRKS
mmetsp:Transcript_11947/g.16521  ORF Transcript_11947/g.16521 Transcript_11947/m.16521 type:complete len:370 (-) Transcript_11947:288-1397(-)